MPVYVSPLATNKSTWRHIIYAAGEQDLHTWRRLAVRQVIVHLQDGCMYVPERVPNRLAAPCAHENACTRRRQRRKGGGGTESPHGFPSRRLRCLHLPQNQAQNHNMCSRQRLTLQQKLPCLSQLVKQLHSRGLREASHEPVHCWCWLCTHKKGAHASFQQ